MSHAPKHVHLTFLGCPKNRADSETLAGLLESSGLTLTTDPCEAGIWVVNTCAFLASAREEALSEILDRVRLKHRTGGGTLVVTGCWAGLDPNGLARAIPGIDLVLGSDRLGELPDILAKGVRERIMAREGVHFGGMPKVHRRVGTAPAGYIKIGDGCSRACSFCLIPKIKGTARSRPMEDLVREAAGLGVRELVLVAQDTSAWGRDLSPSRDLEELVDALARTPGVAWLRVMYLYPTRISDGLLERMADPGHPLVPYVDMPIQHISDRVLAAMGRGYDRARVEEVVHRIRERVPGVSIRTTVITGHPGESRRDFDELLGFLERAGFEQVGVFAYSDEPGTRSHRSPAKVPTDEIQARHREAVTLVREVATRVHARLVGSPLEVMLVARTQDGGWSARHRGQAPEQDGVVHVTDLGGGHAGDLVQVRVTSNLLGDLWAEPLPQAQT